MGMDNMSVGLNSYLDGNEGVSSQGELAELQKAIAAGEITGRETTDSLTDSGAPLKVESLENTLKVITWKENDVVLWKKVPKLPAYNTVEEYNQLVSYGDDGLGAFNNEGELPMEADSVYARRAQLVKFMGVTGAVTHPMQLVTTMIGDVLQREIQNKIQWLLHKADVALAYADSNVVPQQFNGFYQQHATGVVNNQLDSALTPVQYQAYLDSNNVVDLGGSRLSEDAIETAGLGIIENYGYGDTLMAPPEVLSNFVKAFHESKLIQPNTAALTDGVMGQRVRSFMSQFGEIGLEYDKFLKASRPRLPGSGKQNPKAPDAPGVPTVGIVGGEGFFPNGTAADYLYAVAAVNRYGEGDLVPGTGAITVGADVGDALDITFTPGSGTYPPTGYVIYLSEPGGTRYYPIHRFSAAQHAAGWNGAGAGAARVKYQIWPNTESAFLIENDIQIWSFKQLAPLMKMDLAVLEPARRFMVLLYGTPQLYAPKKMVKFINIGNKPVSGY